MRVRASALLLSTPSPSAATPSAQAPEIGSALEDMQKNVDELQKNMGTIKHAKEQLAALAPESGGDAMKKEGESLKKMLPGMGQ